MKRGHDFRVRALFFFPHTAHPHILRFLAFGSNTWQEGIVSTFPAAYAAGCKDTARPGLSATFPVLSPLLPFLPILPA